ncbi:hypothetical protein ABH922_000019 [Rhodococcus sp. 27YEA15]
MATAELMGASRASVSRWDVSDISVSSWAAHWGRRHVDLCRTSSGMCSS